MKLTVGAKFGIITLLAILLVTSAGIVVLYELQLLGKQIFVLANAAEASEEANQLTSEIAELRAGLRDAINQRNRDLVHQRAEGRMLAIKERAANVQRLLNQQGDTELNQVISPTVAILSDQVNSLITLAEAGDWGRAALQIQSDFVQIQEDLAGQLRLLNIDVAQKVGSLSQTVEETRQRAITHILIITVAALLILSLAMALLWRNLAVPIRRLTSSARALAQGDLRVRAQIAPRGDEIGTLAVAFDSMADRLQASHGELAEKIAERTAALEIEREGLRQALADLQTSTAERDRLFLALQQLQNPVIPIIEGVIVAPIIGQLTSQRLEQLQMTLLEEAIITRARVVLLDVTGVPILDKQAAQALIETGSALRLLGAEAVLVGIRPEVAETIISAGIDLQQLAIAADLQHGIDRALRLLRRKIVALTPVSA
ncbi:MAG: hypothetical protein KatS3mg057_0324 [Herpetosiphonaceae bacterium]|nr:MAG: hypothetical protein KatS3mg057_0324 [Herpetosiphonaceae bacterium]